MFSSLKIPPQKLELYLRKQGMCPIAGTDEVGRGCLAGPVVAAAVILPDSCPVSGITDSKLLSPDRRERLYEEILKLALGCGVGIVEVDEIDRINIFQASLKAMSLAVSRLRISPKILLIDGKFKIPIEAPPQIPVIKGDLHCLSISAASIIAKVTRDRLMKTLEEKFPAYRFSAHKGYPTALHRQEIRQAGPSEIHRKSFKLI